MGMNKLPNIHPGEILLKDFLEPKGLSKNALANRIGVPATRIGDITSDHQGITGDTDIRLSRHFGTTEGYCCGCKTLTTLKQHAGKWRRRSGA